MSLDRLTELEALANAATPGPWQPVLGHLAHGQERVGLWQGSEYMGNFLAPTVVSSNGNPVQALHDVQFMAAARTAIPTLITDMRRIMTEMARLRQMADRATSGRAPGKSHHLLPSSVLAGSPPHHYVSTACEHGRLSLSNLHDRCRKACKFCGAKCLCSCHTKRGY